jgi:hypothetical protein
MGIATTKKQLSIFFSFDIGRKKITSSGLRFKQKELERK